MSTITAAPANQEAGLITTIVDIIDRLKADYPRHQVELAVRCQVARLKQMVAHAPPFGKSADNKSYGKEAAALVGELQQLVERMPPGTNMALFVASLHSEHLNSMSPDNVDWDAVEAYRTALLAGLRALARGCAAVGKLGDYQTLDPVKRLCATAAFELIVGLTTARPANGGPLRVIANLLFELADPIATAEWRRAHGGDRPDLRRQCRDVLRHWRKQPDLQACCDELRSLWFCTNDGQ